MKDDARLALMPAARPPTSSPNPRAHCVVIADRSSSMAGTKIDGVNAGLIEFDRVLKSDRLSAADIEVALVGVGGTVEVVTPFTPVPQLTAPRLVANGDTPLADGIVRALQLVKERAEFCRGYDLYVHPPTMVVISDGQETRNPAQFAKVATLLRRAQAEEKLHLFVVGVDEADFEQLQSLSNTPVFRLNGFDFKRLFAWLARSMRSVSVSTPGTIVRFDDPAREGWAHPWSRS